MNLFTLDNGRVKLSTEALTIGEFKKIWERDKSKGKESATEEMAYVFYMTDYKSPYLSYDMEARESKIVKDVITKKDWKPDDIISEARKKYGELQDTPSMGLLKDAEHALDQIRHYFRHVDVTQDVDGSITKTLIANVEKLGGVIKGLGILRELVDKEVSEKKIRGQGSLGLREMPKNR